MSNNRMLALVAILAGGLMVGACGDSVTGPENSIPADPVERDIGGPDGVTQLPGPALLHDPAGSDHVEAYDEDVER